MDSSQRIPILIDESVIVFAERSSHELHSQLMAFLSCKRYAFFMPHTAKLRLGASLWTRFRINFFMARKKHPPIIYPLEKALIRGNIANVHIQKYLKIGCWQRFVSSYEITKLFIYANANKGNSLNRKINPEEVISLDICENVLIANKQQLPIFSFNKDYKHFTHIPGCSNSFITYHDPDIFLRNTNFI